MRTWTKEDEKLFIHQINVLGWSPDQVSNYWNLNKDKNGRCSSAYKKAHDLSRKMDIDVSFKKRKAKRTKSVQDGVYQEPDFVNNIVVRLQHLQDEKTILSEEFKDFEDEELIAWTNDIQKFSNDLFQIRLQDYQLDMIKMWSGNKYSVVSSGHQVGKDLTIAVYALWKGITTSNFLAIIVSPAQRQSDELFNRMLGYISKNRQLLYCIKKQTMDELIFHNGSRILSLPSRGAITGLTGVSCVIINEAGRPELPDRIFDDVMPMTIAKHGHLVLLGNPYGDTNMFAQCLNSPLYAKMTIPTIQNAELDKLLREQGTTLEKWLEVEKQRLSQVEFDQRYRGIPRSMEGAFINGAYIDKACKEYAQHENNESGFYYYCGIDWGRFSNLSCVLVISENNTDKTVRVEHIKLFEKKTLDEVSAWVEYLNTKYRFNRIIPEYSGLSISTVDNMLKGNLGNIISPYKASIQGNFDNYCNLKRLFENGKIIIPMYEPRLISQLRFLEMKITESKKYKITGGDDDIADALMLACSPIVDKQREIMVSISRYR